MNPLKPILLAAALAAGSAQATLHGRDLDPAAAGFEAWYDDRLDVTWLANADLSRTEHFGVAGIDASGGMDHNTAQLWIFGMNQANHLGLADWRLPQVRPLDGASFSYLLSFTGESDHGHAIGAPGTTHAGSTASELAHLHYVTLGNGAGTDASGDPSDCGRSPLPGCLQERGPFRLGNLSGSAPGVFFTGTKADGNPTLAEAVFFFNMPAGFQGYAPLDRPGAHPWALRDGDVAAIPEPSSWALMLAGLAAGGRLLRRRNP